MKKRSAFSLSLSLFLAGARAGARARTHTLTNTQRAAEAQAQHSACGVAQCMQAIKVLGLCLYMCPCICPYMCLLCLYMSRDSYISRSTVHGRHQGAGSLHMSLYVSLYASLYIGTCLLKSNVCLVCMPYMYALYVCLVCMYNSDMCSSPLCVHLICTTHVVHMYNSVWSPALSV